MTFLKRTRHWIMCPPMATKERDSVPKTTILFTNLTYLSYGTYASLSLSCLISPTPTRIQLPKLESMEQI